MARETKRSYKGNKRDRYTIVLEDLTHKFDIFGEALQFTNKNVAQLVEEVADLKTDVSELKIQVSGLNTDVSELKIQVSGLNTDISELKTDFSGLGSKFELMDRKMDAMSVDIIDIKKILHKQDDRLEDHETRITDLERV